MTQEHTFFKSSQEQVQGQYAAIEHAYEEMFKKTKPAMLICGTSIEGNSVLQNSFIEKHKTEIDAGTLTVFAFCSGKTLSNGKTIETITVNGKKLDDSNETNNKRLIWETLFKLADEHESYVIFHVNMLGVGTDLPSINSVVILGDKNETDLFQSIMRGCRVDYTNPEKKDYDVFIYVPKTVKTYMEKFIDTLDTLGGPELIKAFSNDVQQGESSENSDPMFTQLIADKATAIAVKEEYARLINCHSTDVLKADLVSDMTRRLLELYDQGKIEEYEGLRSLWFDHMNKYLT